MGVNTVMLSGRVAAPVEQDALGVLRILITVRIQEGPRRVDVIPVVWEKPTLTAVDLPPGAYVFVTGRLQRRFWDHIDGGRKSKVEVVVESIKVMENEKADWMETTSR